MELYRQGDILLRKINKKEIKGHRVNNILAYGEVSGHKHQFLDEDIKVYEEDGVKIIDISKYKSGELTHEEHQPIKLEEGQYEVIRQRELDLEITQNSNASKFRYVYD